MGIFKNRKERMESSSRLRRKKLALLAIIIPSVIAPTILLLKWHFYKQNAQEVLKGDPRDVVKWFTRTEEPIRVEITFRPNSYTNRDNKLTYFSGLPGAPPVLICENYLAGTDKVTVSGLAIKIHDGVHRGGKIDWYVRVTDCR